jgi:hypothetical protein
MQFVKTGPSISFKNQILTFFATFSHFHIFIHNFPTQTSHSISIESSHSRLQFRLLYSRNNIKFIHKIELNINPLPSRNSYFGPRLTLDLNLSPASRNVLRTPPSCLVPLQRSPQLFFGVQS